MVQILIGGLHFEPFWGSRTTLASYRGRNDAILMSDLQVIGDHRFVFISDSVADGLKNVRNRR